MKRENGQKENFSKTCPLCDNTTWIEVRVDKRNCAYRCECYEKEILNNNNGWKKAGLTIETSKLNFTSFKNWNESSTLIKDLAIRYFKDFDRIKDSRNNSLILSGNPGCGKSHLIMAIANNLIRRRVNVVYMPYREIIIELKQNIMNCEVYNKMMNKYKKAELLLIDDLFKGQITESDVNILFEIINYRYMSNLPMLISTEQTIEKIIEIDEALGSRIYEMVSEYKAEVVGSKNNYRLRGKD
ncbi:ATP-binding protein [Clostridium gasigenes]|uniref:ATP-binding protein n=1 Tax=Clostridium gasigenes TaxID=94869 RepID=UPI001C0C3743|nr:ATP-binding protein [Clostridium gasigenes]MBU3105135.1 ATP-binding protein [Clostridium gasigenes]